MNVDTSIEEVLNDFKSSLSEIDFSSYNPSSAEFNVALRLGLMWHLLQEIGAENVPAVNKQAVEDKPEKDDISGELFDAKKYFQKFLDTGDSVYKEMANDELKHASMLIKRANSKLPSGDEKARLKEYEQELKEILEKVNE